MIQVVEVDSPEGLAACRDIWDSLWRQTPEASFFQTHQWLSCYWKHFGQGKRLRVFMASAAGETLGIVPLVEYSRPTRLGRFATLSYPLDHWGSIYGPIGPQPAATLIAVLRHLAQDRGDWELLDLPWIDETVDRGRTYNAFRLSGLEARVRPGLPVAVVDLTEGFSSYMAERKSPFRQNLVRLTRRAEQAGFSLQRYRPDPGTTPFDWQRFDQTIDLAGRTWQARTDKGNTLSTPEVAPFLREAHAAAVELGMVDIALLCRGDQAVAYAYNYHHGGIVQGLRTGYDPEFKEFGPGTVLFGLMLRDGAQRGDRLYDLGSDHEPVKRGWASAWRSTCSVCHYRRSGWPRTVALKWGHRCREALSQVFSG